MTSTRCLPPGGLPIASIARALSQGDYQLDSAHTSVVRPTVEQAGKYEKAILGYGPPAVHLVELPEDTWASSVVQYWGGGYWQALVDLWTEEEGRSDLCLGLDVHEAGDDYTYQVTLIYVP